MTWTYTRSFDATDEGSAVSANLNAVRFRIGDTDASDPLLSDEEINYLIAQQGSVVRAALYACKAIAAKFARRVNMTQGPNSIDASDRFKHYSELITELSDELGLSDAMPYAGGISIADKTANEGDTDIVKPSFTRTLHDVPGPDPTGFLR